jgi:hypothetical protein
VAIAPRIAEVVRFAGGWLFDQVMAGWDVTVLTSDHGDARPLRILGARAADLEAALARPVQGPCLQAIAVRADLFGSDVRVRRMVLGLGEGRADVRLFGDEWPDGADGTDGPVWHQLSVAARAFKVQALAAAAAPVDSCASAEEFRTSGISPASPVPAR